jgi:hypothetical protein
MPDIFQTSAPARVQDAELREKNGKCNISFKTRPNCPKCRFLACLAAYESVV